jgi:DNA-binding protein HU-beta
MNKQELIGSIAKKSGLSKAQSGKALQAAIGSMTQALHKGESVQLIGFGSFNVTKRKARTGRNPRTGAQIKIAAKKVPSFRPGKALRDSTK